MNALSTIMGWIILSVLMVYAAVVCVGVFKAHHLNADRAWKRLGCRACTALAVALPVLSLLKTVELACLAICG